jgi:hypothetical protein
MDNSTFLGASLSDVKVIMTIMHILIVKLLCQMVMGWIPVLECPLPGTHGRLGLCLNLSSIKWPHNSRTLTLGPFAWYLGYPQAWL